MMLNINNVSVVNDVDMAKLVNHKTDLLNLSSKMTSDKFSK